MHIVPAQCGARVQDGPGDSRPGGGPIQVQAQPAKVEDILRNMDDEQRAALFATLGGILEGKIGETGDKMQDTEGNPAENDTVPPAG